MFNAVAPTNQYAFCAYLAGQRFCNTASAPEQMLLAHTYCVAGGVFVTVNAMPEKRE